MIDHDLMDLVAKKGKVAVIVRLLKTIILHSFSQTLMVLQVTLMY